MFNQSTKQRFFLQTLFTYLIEFELDFVRVDEIQLNPMKFSQNITQISFPILRCSLLINFQCYKKEHSKTLITLLAPSSKTGSAFPNIPPISCFMLSTILLINLYEILCKILVPTLDFISQVLMIDIFVQLVPPSLILCDSFLVFPLRQKITFLNWFESCLAEFLNQNQIMSPQSYQFILWITLSFVDWLLNVVTCLLLAFHLNQVMIQPFIFLRFGFMELMSRIHSSLNRNTWFFQKFQTKLLMLLSFIEHEIQFVYYNVYCCG